jgi:hypothetical protein
LFCQVSGQGFANQLSLRLAGALGRVAKGELKIAGQIEGRLFHVGQFTIRHMWLMA